MHVIVVAALAMAFGSGTSSHAAVCSDADVFARTRACLLQQLRSADGMACMLKGAHHCTCLKASVFNLWQSLT